jgi:hypothetical protein
VHVSESEDDDCDDLEDDDDGNISQGINMYIELMNDARPVFRGEMSLRTAVLGPHSFVII